MAMADEIRKTMIGAMAGVFDRSEEELSSYMDADLIDDFGATSLQYFPVISALEEEFDIELQYQDFRREGRTINKATSFVEQVYRETYGE